MTRNFGSSMLGALAAASLVGVAVGEISHTPSQFEFAPDTIGGYTTEYILIKLDKGVEPRISPAGFASINRSIDSAMQYWGVESMSPAALEPFKYADSAAKIGLDRWYRLNVPAGTDTLMMMAHFSGLEGVEVAEIAGIGTVADIPNDPSFNLQYALHNTGQVINGQSGTADADVDGPEAWDYFTGADNITLAVIDSGVNSHPEFADRMVPGWNTYNDSSDTSDACPHGTHCAGIAGAKGNNGQGVAGASWDVKIMPVRVLLGCGGNTDQCANGIIYAVDHGAHIGTMSLQYYTYSQYFEDSTEYAADNNVLLIAANGNGAGRLVAWPAKFPLVMGVAATTNRDQLASFSNYGPECDISAPGQDVYSTWVGNGYTYLSGTSMATPLVAGAASLVWSFDQTLTATEVWDLLLASVDDLGTTGWDERYGHGRLNMELLMQAVGNPRMELDAGLLRPGRMNEATLAGATPGGRVYLAYSLAGEGSTDVPQLGVTLGLQSPRLATSATADANGDATFRTMVPGGTRGLDVWLQAAEVGNVSNVVPTRIN